MGHDGQERIEERKFVTAAKAVAESPPNPTSELEVQRLLHPSRE
jgi:hypothetical protein